MPGLRPVQWISPVLGLPGWSGALTNEDIGLTLGDTTQADVLAPTRGAYGRARSGLANLNRAESG